MRTTVIEVAPDNVGKATACDGLVWVDFDHTDERGTALLPDLFDVHSADLEDCHIRTPVPKLHRYPDHHFTAINGLARGVDDRLYFVPLKVFQHSGLVVTVLGPTSTALPEHAARTEISVVQERLDAEGFRPTTSLEVITAIRPACWSPRRRKACWPSTSGGCAICVKGSASSCRPLTSNANTSRK